jgi:hypothetical protein
MVLMLIIVFFFLPFGCSYQWPSWLSWSWFWWSKSCISYSYLWPSWSKSSCWSSSFSSLLVTTIIDLLGCHDLDLSGLNLTSFVLASLVVACNPLGHSLHVGHHLPSPPSWLQLLVTFLIVMIVVLVVQILHLLCLQLFATLLVMNLMLIIIFLLLPFGCSD